MDERVSFPGPAALGRGVVVAPGGEVPPDAREWPRLGVDEAVAAAPDEVVATLDAAWRARQPTVVELGVPLAALKQPETCDLPPHDLDPGFTFTRERLHFLIWANRYDGRGDQLRWHHATRAQRLGATPAPEPSLGDVLLPDGTPAWIDGGPRTGRLLDPPAQLVHVNQLWAGSLAPDRWRAPGDTLAPDQLAAVGHAGGAARVLAPAGSGKTRVLTARLRHLLVDRAWAPGTVTALAYNTRAAEEMRARTGDVAGAQVRTLHSLGFDILGQARGGRPRVLDERTTRDLLQELAPVRPRANDDVYAPYIEALAEVRAALRSPELVELQRDDVPDFARVFTAYRERLADRGAIDFDEQVYGAVEVLLRNAPVRQAAQRRCAHVLLDELQDLTPAQLLLVRLLAAPALDVYGVGDDDQVIYGYAGADPRFLVDYDQFFPGAAGYLLEVNYRCPAPVVEAATHLLSYNHQRVPKTVRPASTGSDGSDGSDGRDGAGEDHRAEATGVTSGLVVERHDDAELGHRLVELIQGLVADGVPAADIAVLTRVNAGLLAPQVLLAEAGVPVQGPVDERMLDRTGTRAALAWLRLADAAASGQPLDGGDLATVARRPTRGLSPGILRALGRGTWPMARLAGFARGLDDARLREKLTGLHDDLARLAARTRSPSGVTTGGTASAGDRDDRGRAGGASDDGAGGGRATTAELLLYVRDVIGLGRALDRLDDARSAPGGGHIDDLDALILVGRAHPDPTDFEPWLRRRLRTRSPGRRRDGAADPPSPPSPDWWADSPDSAPPPPDSWDPGPDPDGGGRLTPGRPGPSASPSRPERRGQAGPPSPVRTGRPAPVAAGSTADAGPAESPDGRVTLSTVHRVKGLEWPHVVVWDASEGVMPHRLNESGPFLEEERRVFHVALTRARGRATVLARAGAPSSFLAEVTGEAPHGPPPAPGRRGEEADGAAPSGRQATRGESAPGRGDDAADRLARRRAARVRGGADDDEPLDPAATKRADALKEWRRRRAAEDGVPAYVILHDRHIHGIARRAPGSLDDLAGCDGIGPTKLDRYGDDILAALADLP